MDEHNEIPPVSPGSNVDTKVIDKDYFQKQGAEQPINVLPNIRDMVDKLNLDPETFDKQLKNSSEKVARYAGEREKGIDGKPLSGEAAEAQDVALQAEVEQLSREIFAKLSAGHSVGKDHATDVLMFNLAVDSKKADPEELKKIYEGVWAKAMQADQGEHRGFDAWTKLTPRRETFPHHNQDDISEVKSDSIDKIGKLDKTREALKQERATALASQFHENWRKTRLNAEGNFESRVKPTTDEAWIAVHSSNQVDIANTSYQDLPKDWQAENKAAAEVVVGILDEANGNLDLGNPETRSRVGQKVHEAWLSRNGWAKDGDLDKLFDELPAAEQDKDIQQVEIGLGLLKKSADSQNPNLNNAPTPAPSGN